MQQCGTPPAPARWPTPGGVSDGEREGGRERERERWGGGSSPRLTGSQSRLAGGSVVGRSAGRYRYRCRRALNLQLSASRRVRSAGEEDERSAAVSVMWVGGRRST